MRLLNETFYIPEVLDAQDSFKVGQDVLNIQHFLALRAQCPVLYVYYSSSIYTQEKVNSLVLVSLKTFLDSVTQVSSYTHADTLLELGINAQAGNVELCHSAPVVLKPFKQLLKTWKIVLTPA